MGKSIKIDFENKYIIMHEWGAYSFDYLQSILDKEQISMSLQTASAVMEYKEKVLKLDPYGEW